MEDFPDLPILKPKESLQLVSNSGCSKAQKLLIASLITQSRSFIYTLKESQQELIVLDVTHFLNHRINTKLMETIGEELANTISPMNPELILTAPSSGNIPALSTALKLPNRADVIYAPKGMPITMTEVYQAKSRSYTHGKAVDLTVAKDCLPKNTRVAICDDFLDSGKTGIDLYKIVEQANAQTVCFFFVIEKPFGGRKQLNNLGFKNEHIVSLVKIESMRVQKIKIAGFDYWFELARK